MKTPLLLLCWSGLLAAQIVQGDIYDSITGAPVDGASISTQTGSNPAIVKSDAGGHFQIAASPNFSLGVTRPGYLGTQAKTLANQIVRVALIPEAVIAGKIEDDDGFPVSAALLQAMSYRTVNGKRTLVNTTGFAQTDDRGEYRFEGLRAGRYYLGVTSTGSAATWDGRYVSQFRGGTQSANDEQAVEVKAGEIRRDIVIRLAKYQGVTLSGRVESTGATVVNHPLFVSLRSNSREFAGYSAGQLSISKNEFTMRHVPPGDFTLQYRSGYGNLQIGDLTDSIVIKVGSTDIQNLVLHPRPLQGIELSGKITMQEGGDPGLWTVRLTAPSGGTTLISSAPDGTFVVKDLLPGHYNLSILPTARPAVRVTSALLGDTDVLRTGIDIVAGLPPLKVTATGKAAIVTGVLLDADSNPVVGQRLYFIAATSARPEYGVTNAEGKFQASLPAEGIVHVLVIDNDELQTRGEEDYLKAHENDLPPIRVMFGDNAPIVLKKK